MHQHEVWDLSRDHMWPSCGELLWALGGICVWCGGRIIKLRWGLKTTHREPVTHPVAGNMLDGWHILWTGATSCKSHQFFLILSTPDGQIELETTNSYTQFCTHSYGECVFTPNDMQRIQNIIISKPHIHLKDDKQQKNKQHKNSAYTGIKFSESSVMMRRMWYKCAVKCGRLVAM